MSSESLLSLINNAALLLALAVLNDVLPYRPELNMRLFKILTGVILGLIGIALMITPWQFAPGVIFDTRSVLLSIAGLFFGFVPTVVAVLITSLFRLYQGGAGAWTGVGVILTSAGIGLAWRYYRWRWFKTFGWLELYIFGLVVHIAMLLWMLTLPQSIATMVLRNVPLPMMIVYPIGTVLLGKLLARQNERREAEQAVQDNEERLRQVVQNMPVMLDALDAEDNIIVWNQECERVTGYTATEIVGNPQTLELLYPDEQQRQQMMTAVAEQEFNFRNLEWNITCKDGTVKTISWSNLSQEIPIPGWFTWAVGVDVTGRKQSETKFRAVVEQSLTGIYILQENQFIYFNQRLLDMFGYSEDELLSGFNPIDLIAAEDRQLVTDNIRRRLTGEIDTIHYTARGQRKDGTLFWLDIHGNHMELAGEPVVTGTVLDISESKRAENDLIESERRYRALFENIPAGFVLFEVVQDDKDIPVDLIIIAANNGFETTTGLKIQDVVGKRLTRALPGIENDAAGWIGTYGKIALTGEAQQFEQGSELLGYYYSVTAYQAGPKQCAVTFLDITDRKQAEKALQESEERYRKLISEMSNGFALHEIICDDAGVPYDYRFLETNAAFEQLTGVDTATIVGKTVLEILPQTKPEWIETYGQVALSGKPIQFERYNQELQKYFEVLAYSPQEGQFATVFTDITARKQVEESLQESEQRFKRALENIPDVIVIYDADMRIQYINSATRRLTGRPTSDFIGKREEEIWPPEVYETYLPTVKEAFATGEVCILETDLSLPDGGFRSLIITCVPLLDENGKVREVVGITHDLTERKQAEEALQRYTERLTILREIDRDIVVTRSPEDIVNGVLRRIRKLIPCTRVSVSLFEMDTKEAILFAIDNEQDSTVQPGRRVPLEHNQQIEKLKSGQSLLIPDLRPLEASLSSSAKQLIKEGIRSAVSVPLMVQQQLIGVFSLLNTIPDYFTAEHQQILEEVANQLAIAIHQHQLNEQIQRHAEELEKRVQQRTAELEAANKEMEAFTYSVSHDLKAPLRGIDGYSRLLLRDYADKLDDDGRHFLHTVRRAAQQMSQLIEDLLAYSRLERRPLESGSVNPQALIESLLAEQVKEVQARNITINVDVPCHAVAADPDGLAMALRNLLDNALKFTADVPEPVIEVGGRETDNICILWVRDNGVGFDMKFHDRIFEIFQRLQRTEEYTGTGIGLALVRKAMQRMDGNVWAESEPGQGATFYLEMPR